MQVALFGVSYDAGAAVRAAAQKHPAVKAMGLRPVLHRLSSRPSLLANAVLGGGGGVKWGVGGKENPKPRNPKPSLNPRLVTRVLSNLSVVRPEP